MPYKNIVFVKLEKRLLDDPRWWTMSDYSQLLYAKLILLAANLGNKIPIDPLILSQAVRCSLPIAEFNRSLEEVKNNFPKFKRRSLNGKDFYYFSNFHEKTNYIPKKEVPGKSQGLPKDVVDKDKDKKRIDLNHSNINSNSLKTKQKRKCFIGTCTAEFPDGPEFHAHVSACRKKYDSERVAV